MEQVDSNGDTRNRLRWIRRAMWACWIVFAVICVLHFWADGRSIRRMQELVRADTDPKEAPAMVTWLCGSLNKAAILVLLAIVGLSIAGRQQRRSPEPPQA